MKPSGPNISAVIPAYNREKTIGRAIRSVLAQKAPPFEAIVVDDGSTDGTLDSLTSFGDRIVVVRQRRGGASASRNRGVKEARGEWVAFLDSDDFWYETHLENVTRAIHETGGRADLYFADILFAPSLGGRCLWDLCGFSPGGPHRLVPDASEWGMMAIQPMMLQTSVFRREAYLGLGGLREDLLCRHDTYLFLEASLGRPACAVAGVGAKMTDDDDSGSRVTAEHGPNSPQFSRETEILYRDLLARHALAPEDRRELRYRLASAQLRLARLAGARGNALSAVRYVLRALSNSPRRLGETLARRSFLAGRR